MQFPTCLAYPYNGKNTGTSSWWGVSYFNARGRRCYVPEYDDGFTKEVAMKMARNGRRKIRREQLKALTMKSAKG
jgi:hypothetical protein